MSASECVNHLVYDFFWELRAHLRAEHFLGNYPGEELHWASDKREIAQRFGISQAYFKSLRQMHRKVCLDDYAGVIRWLQSHVAECHREEVSRLVKDLLPI